MSTDDREQRPYEMGGPSLAITDPRSRKTLLGEQSGIADLDNHCPESATTGNFDENAESHSAATSRKPVLRLAAGRVRSGRHGAETSGRARTAKKTLGQVLKQRRHDMELTQRELAAKIGVKPAHIAHLELDRRRPSLTLLGRIADVLKLERESLFALSHPEAKTFISARRKATPDRSKDRVWRDFKSDRHTLADHGVTGAELKVLSHVNLLGKVTAPRNFLFILNSIREAAEEEE